MMIDIDIADFVEDISVIVDYIPDITISNNKDIVNEILVIYIFELNPNNID